MSNIPIAVQALSNGTSGVSLDVSTPTDVPIGDTVPLKFRVNAVGVGNILTVLVFSPRAAVVAAAPSLRSTETTSTPASYPACLVSTNSVRIVTDSACDLPQAVADELGIEIVPLTIRIDGHEFVDRRDLTPAEFWSSCASSPNLPETAAPAPGEFEATYRRLAADGATGIVVISLSAALSATMQSAELAARNVADLVPVTVIDSRNCTMGLGMIAADCARLAIGGAVTRRRLRPAPAIWPIARGCGAHSTRSTT